MNSAIGALLQLTASLLLTAKAGSLPVSSVQAVIQTASRSVQISAQQLADIPPGFVQAKNDGIWPNVKDLRQSLYLDARGAYAPLGQNVRLLEQYTSFGDMNGDGVDDAVAVVSRISSSGALENDLAMMLNQNGAMFNVADVPLGSSATIDSHHVVNGKFVMGTNGSPTMQQYTLLGDELFPY